MIDTHIPLWGILLLALSTIGGIIKLYMSHKDLERRMKDMENRVKAIEADTKALVEALKSEIHQLNNTLIVVKNNVDLLILGRLKTGNNREKEN